MTGALGEEREHGKVLGKQKQGKEESRNTSRGWSPECSGKLEGWGGTGFVTTVQAGCVYPGSDPEPWEGFGWGTVWAALPFKCTMWKLNLPKSVSCFQAGCSPHPGACRVWTFWSVRGSYYVPINRYELCQ